jgi:hypothetical protein
VAAYPTSALPYVLLHRAAELPNVESTITEDLGSIDKAAIRAAAKAIRHWARLSAVGRVPKVPPTLVVGLVERTALRCRPAAVSCLVQLTLLLAECPAAITPSDAALLSASLIPWYKATVPRGDDGYPDDGDEEEPMQLRPAVGALAGALRTWYSAQSPGVPEPLGIAKWEQWCACDVLPEVRRAFRTGVTIHAARI